MTASQHTTEPWCGLHPKDLMEPRAAQIRVATVIYREYCVNCHGKDGKGLELKPAMPKIPDFTSTSAANLSQG